MRQQVFFLIITTVLLASCQHEREWEGAPEIKAKVESEKETRTSLSVDESGAGTIYWNPSDKIDVFFGTKKVHYTSQNTSDATIATFKTSESVSGSDVSSTNIWGLYPSNSSSSCNGSSITTTLPSTQYGVPNTFDKDLFPAVAHSSSTDLQFYNVCGGIKFNLAYDDIKQITFRGNNNEDLAGTVSISFVDNLPKATIVNGVKEITLTPKTGTTFTKGADYYFILLPGTLSAGFTITFTATDGTTGTLSYTDNPVTIKRSIFGKKGNMDVYAAFSDDRQPNNVIYYTSTDGQIVIPHATDVFGANIVSNEYIGDQGVLSFDGSVTNIGYKAFSGCRSLASIQIPHSVTKIGNDTFAYCSLTSFELPSSVTQYSKSLRACSGLESIVVEPGNPSYDSRGGCNAIIETSSNTLIDGCMNTVIPNSVTRIGDSAFMECSGLTSIIIPNSVTDIATLGFSHTRLTSLDIPNSVTSIGYGAFCWTKLTSVSIPASVVSLRGSSSYYSDVENPFYGCSDLSSITVNPNNPSYDSRNNCNAIINSVTNELVSGCKNTIIPTSVSSIGNEAFYNCRSLTSIDIPNSVTSIGFFAFAGCIGLTSIEIPSSVTSIGVSAFRDCYGLTSIMVYALTPPDLGTTVFEYTNSCPIYVPAQSVDAYKTADGWSEYADRIQAMPSQNNVIYYTSTDGQVVTPNMSDVFGANIVSNEYVDGRGVITFDGDVSYIEAHAFYNCADLISIEIPGSVTRIGNYAFSTTGLTSLEIPNSVSSIGMSAFASTNLTSVEIPSSITSIGTNPFLNCSTLTTITVDSGNSTYDSRGGCNAIIHTSTNELISGCSGTIIPNTVSSIGNNAFYGCEGLTYLEIPNSITSIGNSSFQSCSNLTGVEIPDSVTSIGSSAFYSTGRMSSIIIYAVSPPTVGSSAFAMTNGSPIYVPAQSVNAYKSAWSVYADRIQAIPDIHEAVDLGLSVKWATCNVGASSPEEYGDYFAWGETEAKTDYSWSTYRWCNGSVTTLTKYNTKSNYGTVDNKTVLDLSDDAARANLGGSWRMPTDAEWTELRTQCVWTWTTLGGKNGYNVRGPNGNTIFLPAAGSRDGPSLGNAGSNGGYWSSSLNTDGPSYALYVGFYSSHVYRDYRYRYGGRSVRPVYGAFISVERVSLNKSTMTITEGETDGLMATVIPANASGGQDVSWSSSDPSVASVSSGHVTAVSPGTATITAWASDGTHSANCVVTVSPAQVAVTGVSLDHTTLTLTVGATQTLTANVAPSNATNKNVSWSSSNTTVATVSASGVVTAKKVGSATITVTTEDGGKTATCSVSVIVNVTSVSLNKTALTLAEGNTYTLIATVSPTNATDKSVTWSSSNTNVATVSATGVVSANRAGTTTITVTTTDRGKTATCTVTVHARITGTENGHEWVDLGLPSGLKWATCNVGASYPEGCGDYFAWGETSTKSDYSWSTYRWCNGSNKSLTKYNTDSGFGTVDNRTELLLSNDAARSNWGGNWRMPTNEELTELLSNCSWEWTTENGVNGRKGTGPNGDFIFLPAAGRWSGKYLNNSGTSGVYWSSSLYTNCTCYAKAVILGSDSIGGYFFYRCDGLSVRPVYK